MAAARVVVSQASTKDVPPHIVYAPQASNGVVGTVRVRRESKRSVGLFYVKDNLCLTIRSHSPTSPSYPFEVPVLECK